MIDKTNKLIYCDYAATAPLHPEVRAAMTAAEEQFIGNPSSIHRPGQAARVALERARATLAAHLEAQPAEIIFTSGGTEANNLVLFGLLQPGDHVVISETEHPSVVKPLERLAPGVKVTRVKPASGGEVGPEAVAAAIKPKTRLVSIMTVNNETGVINDIAAIGALAAEKDVLFHTDAVQALGKLPLNPAQDGVHFLSASAHKLSGPKGMGLLYARRGIKFEPLQLGGTQENQHRGGTENLPGAIGFAQALELVIADQDGHREHLAHLRELFLTGLAAAGVIHQVNGPNGWPGIVNLRFPGVHGQALVVNLDLENVAISYGSSCASGSTKASDTLLAMGLTEQAATESVRFSFGPGTTTDEVQLLAKIVARVISKQVPTGQATALAEN